MAHQQGQDVDGQGRGDRKAWDEAARVLRPPRETITVHINQGIGPVDEETARSVARAIRESRVLVHGREQPRGPFARAIRSMQDFADAARGLGRAMGVEDERSE